MKLSNKIRQKLRQDILRYLGSDVLSVELTTKMLDLAIDLGNQSYIEGKGKLFDLCLGHSMIMLGTIRSKFSSVPIPGGSIDMKQNVQELMKTGRKLIGKE